MELCFYCSRSASNACNHCDGIWYCSEQHRAIHQNSSSSEDSRDDHHRCWPFKVGFNPRVGRELHASRNISAGEVVLVDKAALVVPDLRPVCLVCYGVLKKSGGLSTSYYRCSKCKFPLCNEQCETDPGLHGEYECELFAARGLAPKEEDLENEKHFLYNCVGILRFLLWRRKKLHDWLDMETHWKIRLTDADTKEGLRRISVFLRDVVGLQPATFEEVTSAFGALRTNSMAFGGGCLNASAVYPILSLASHACVPNLEPMRQIGLRFGFTAQRDIQKGESLTISYLASTWEHRIVTRETLRQKWLFNCECDFCRDQTEFGTFLSCPLCASFGGTCPGWMVSKEPLQADADWQCLECGETKTVQDIMVIEESARSIAERDQTPEETRLIQLRALVHPSHHEIVKLKLRIILSATGKTPEAIGKVFSYCQDILTLQDKMAVGTSKLSQRVMRHLVHAKLCVLQERQRKGLMTKEDILGELSRCNILSQHP